MIPTKYKNLWTLYKWNKDVSKIKSPERFIENYYFFRPKKKGCNTRNLIASILKQLRVLFPYKIQDYSEAEKMYKEYFSLENHISSIEFLREKVKNEEVWVTCFRKEYPIKGKRYCEYYVNGSGGVKTFKLSPIEQTYGFVSDPFVNEFGFSVQEKNLTQFRFATLQEIQTVKDKEKESQKIKIQIEARRKEIENLYTKLNKLN